MAEVATEPLGERGRTAHFVVVGLGPGCPGSLPGGLGLPLRVGLGSGVRGGVGTGGCVVAGTVLSGGAVAPAGDDGAAAGVTRLVGVLVAGVGAGASSASSTVCSASDEWSVVEPASGSRRQPTPGPAAHTAVPR